MGAGRRPPGSGQKPDRRRLREAGGLRLVASGSGPVEGAPLTDFCREVSGGRLLSREGPHLVLELPASLPQPGTASLDTGLVFTCPPCLEVLGGLSFKVSFRSGPRPAVARRLPPNSPIFRFRGVCTGLAADLASLRSAELHLLHAGASPTSRDQLSSLLGLYLATSCPHPVSPPDAGDGK